MLFVSTTCTCLTCSASKKVYFDTIQATGVSLIQAPLHVLLLDAAVSLKTPCMSRTHVLQEFL
jgi:hypothetical protein